MSPTRASFYGWAVFTLLVLSVLQTRWVLSGTLPFIVDEMVDTQLAVDVSRGAELYGDRPFERMPLMTLWLAATHDDARTSYETLMAARHGMWLVSLLVAVGTFWAAGRLLGWPVAAVAVVLLLGFSAFVERGLRIRADLLSTLFSLSAFAVVTGPALRRGTLLVAGLALGLAFVTTQKAVYFVAAFAVALATRHLAEASRDIAGWRSASAAFGPIARSGLWSAAAFLVPLGAVSGWLYSAGRLRDFFEQTLFHGAYVGLVADVYSYSSTYLLQSAQRNPGFWLFGVAGTCWFAIRSVRDDVAETPRRLAAAAWMLTMLVAVLQHTAKFPYVFLNLAPYLSIAGAALVVALWRATRRRGTRRTPKTLGAAGILAVLFLGFPAWHHLRHLGTTDLEYQRQVMARVESLTELHETVLDGAGMVVTRRKATPYSLTGRWAAERVARKQAVLPWVVRNEPPVMIANYRTRGLVPERPYLSRWYLPDWGPVLVAGARVEAPADGEGTTSRFELIFSGRYALRGRDLEGVLLDGRPAEAVMELAAGDHEVSFPSHGGGALELRLARSLEVPPAAPYPAVQARLFASYSD